MIRVKIEIVPHGIESEAEVLDTVLIINDGTSMALGENEGGIGNYEVHDNGSVSHLNNVDYPHMYACGFIEGVERTPTHRFFVAEQALGLVQEARKMYAEGKFDGPNAERPPRRDFTPKSTAAENCPAKECLDPGGYCANGDCLAAK